MVESISELRRICQPKDAKGNIVDSLYRKVSIYFTKFFLYMPITANQITILFAICGVISGILFAIGDYWLSLIGSGILFFHYILDYVDGEVARYRKSASQKGAFLDIICHNIVFAFIFSGISCNIYFHHNDPLILFVGSIISSLIIINFSIFGLRQFFENKKTMHSQKKKYNFEHIIQNLSILWTPFGITHIIILTSIANMLTIVLILYAFLTPFWLSIQLYILALSKQN